MDLLMEKFDRTELRSLLIESLESGEGFKKLKSFLSDYSYGNCDYDFDESLDSALEVLSLISADDNTKKRVRLRACGEFLIEALEEGTQLKGLSLLLVLERDLVESILNRYRAGVITKSTVKAQIIKIWPSLNVTESEVETYFGFNETESTGT